MLDGISFGVNDLVDLPADQVTKGLPVVFDCVFSPDGKPHGKNMRFGAGDGDSCVTISSGGWGTKRPAEQETDGGWDQQEQLKKAAKTVPEGVLLRGTVKRFRPFVEDDEGTRKGG